MKNPHFTPGQLTGQIALGVGGLIMALPFIQMISTSLKSSPEIVEGGLRLLPRDWHVIENYTAALTQTPMLRFMANGLFITCAILALQILIALPAAYALAKLRWRGREALFAVVLFCLLVPLHAVAIPLYVMIWKAGLLDSYWAIILPYTISPFGIFLIRQFFMSVPDDLIDAGRMDGMSETSIIWSVMLPAAIPAVTAFGIFSVISHWNEYFWPLIVVSSQEYFTPALGITAFRKAEAGYEYGPLMAAATMVVAPLLVAFLFAQRRFIDGITFTGLK